MYRILILLVVIFISACNKNAFDQFQKGNTEDAYKTLYKKAKKKKLDRDEKKLFETVLNEIILEDSISYFRLLSYDQLIEDRKAYDLYEAMDKRQKQIDELRYNLPNYTFLDFRQYDLLSNKICDALFDEANVLIGLSQASRNKLEARDAFSLLDEMERYHTNRNYQIQQAKDIAYELAIDYILVELDEKVFSYNYEINRHYDFNKLNLSNSNWKVYHERNEFKDYSYLVEIVLEDADFYDNSSTNSRNYSEKVLVRTETVKDTLGNTTNTDIYDDVYATVYTEEITRTLRLRGEVEIRSFGGSRYDDDIDSDYSERLDKIWFTGDERAIPSRLRNDINKEPDFSSESDFFEEAIDDFLDDARRIIENLD